MYSDGGMCMEANKVCLLFSNSYVGNLILNPSNFDHGQEQFANATNELVNSLAENGQEVGAFRVSMYAKRYLHSLSYTKDFLSGSILQISCSTFQKAIQKHSPDMPFLICILSSLPQDLFQKCYNKFKKQWQTDSHRILMLYAVAIEIFLIHDQIDLAIALGKTWDRLSWYLKHVKAPLSAEEMLSLESIELYPFIKNVITSHNISQEAVASYCRLFDLDYYEVLEHYLLYLLTGSEVKKWNLCLELPQKDVQALLWKARCIVQQFTNEEALLELLCKCLKQANPYFYEIILFLLENVIELPEAVSPEAVETYKKGISLLKFLTMYARVTAPSADEIKEWSKSDSLDGPLPLISQIRLPFHALISKSKVHKIINPELSSSTVSIWLAVSSFLNLSHDQLIAIAVKNTALNYVEHQKSSTNYTSVNSLPDVHLLTPMLKFLRQIQDPKLLLACLTSIVKMMPLGPNKIILAKMAIRLAQQHATAFDNLNVQANVTAMYQDTATELILTQYDLAKEEYLAKVQYPEQLVWQLIETCQLSIKCSINVCKATEEIAKIVSLNIDEMLFIFLCRCLTPCQVTPCSPNESFIFKDDQLGSDMDVKTNRRNLKRAVSIALGTHYSLFIKLLKSVFQKFHDASYVHKVRVLQFILSAADSKTIYDIVGLSSDNLRKELNELTCVAELDSLHLPYSIQMFRNCDKLEVIGRVLVNLSHNPQGLMCCVKICLVYNIWDTQVWLVILKNMKDLCMRKELQEILTSASGNLVHIWHEKAFVSAWEFLITSSRENESFEAGAITDTLLLRCPCTSLLDSTIQWRKI